MGSQPEAILAYGYNLGDLHNEWLFERAGIEDDDLGDVDDDFMEKLDDLIGAQPGVAVVLHAYEWNGRALVLSGRSFRHGYGWHAPIDPDALTVDDADRQLVVDAANALGLVFPNQPYGPGWLLLNSLG